MIDHDAPSPPYPDIASAIPTIVSGIDVTTIGCA